MDTSIVSDQLLFYRKSDLDYTTYWLEISKNNPQNWWGNIDLHLILNKGLSCTSLMLSSLPTILIADDEPNICRIAKLIIPSDKYNVITSENGIDAFEKALQYLPDIIFADILMPNVMVLSCARKLKQMKQHQKYPYCF